MRCSAPADFCQSHVGGDFCSTKVFLFVSALFVDYLQKQLQTPLFRDKIEVSLTGAIRVGLLQEAGIHQREINSQIEFVLPRSSDGSAR